MKRIKIECFDAALFVYCADEREKFEKTYNCDVGKAYGFVCGNGIWIGDHDDIIGVIYHEAVHAADWVIESRLGCRFKDLEASNEIRAYMTEFIGNKVRKYIVGE